MTQRFIVRLLDDAGTLLAWAEVFAQAKPQAPRGASCPFWASPTPFVIETNGVATRIAVHWPDLDVARMQALVESTVVQVGQIFTFTWMEPVWLVAGMRDVPLPAVTVRAPVKVVVPVGSLAAIT